MVFFIVIGNRSSEAIRDLGQQKSGFSREIAMEKRIKKNELSGRRVYSDTTENIEARWCK